MQFKRFNIHDKPFVLVEVNNQIIGCDLNDSKLQICWRNPEESADSHEVKCVCLIYASVKVLHFSSVKNIEIDKCKFFIHDWTQYSRFCVVFMSQNSSENVFNTIVQDTFQPCAVIGDRYAHDKHTSRAQTSNNRRKFA